jgi:aspartate kinase
VGISMLQEVTKRAKDNLVSFGERMSTRIFAAYLRRCVPYLLRYQDILSLRDMMR